MQYTPRTIAFLADLVHLPAARDPRAIQRLHNAQFERGEPVYRNFAVTGDGSVLSNPVENAGGHSSVAFGPDRIRFREELTGLTPEEFGRRVHSVAAEVVRLVPIQLFTAQQVVVRTLVNPRHFKDSRRFLASGMFGFGGETADFGREPQLYGIRMVFPPDPSEPNAHAVRIESFNSDPRSVFVEDQATFGPLAVEHGLAALEERVTTTYRFVVERVLPFLSRFDARQQA